MKKLKILKLSQNSRYLQKLALKGTQNVIYVKAWYSHDNSLGQAVPGAANLANEVIGRFQG